MMSAPLGSSSKVSGMRIAVPAVGPSPGSTPISVPARSRSGKGEILQAHRRSQARQKVLEGFHARFSNPERADRQRPLEPVKKDVKYAETSCHRGQDDGRWRARTQYEQQAGDEQQHGQPETEQLEQCCRGGQRDQHDATLQRRLAAGQDSSVRLVRDAQVPIRTTTVSANPIKLSQNGKKSGPGPNASMSA